MGYPKYNPDLIRTAEPWDGRWPEPGRLYRFNWKRDGDLVKPLLAAGEITLTPYTYIIAAFPDEIAPDPIFKAKGPVR